jgi:hypothetical protein
MMIVHPARYMDVPSICRVSMASLLAFDKIYKCLTKVWALIPHRQDNVSFLVSSLVVHMILGLRR